MNNLKCGNCGHIITNCELVGCGFPTNEKLAEILQNITSPERPKFSRNFASNYLTRARREQKLTYYSVNDDTFNPYEHVDNVIVICGNQTKIFNTQGIKISFNTKLIKYIDEFDNETWHVEMKIGE